MNEKPKSPLADLLLHVKNRPVFHPLPLDMQEENGIDEVDNDVTDYQRWIFEMKSWVEELVGKTQALALSLSVAGKEPALRKRLEDLEAKAKTYIERIKELNARFQPLDSNMSLETYLEEKKKIKYEKTVSVADVKELLGGSQEPRKEKRQ